MRIEARAGRREGVGQRRRKRHACGEGSAQEAGFQDTRGAHIEHAVHARNFRGVEAQRLVEARRALPSRKEGIRDAGRGAAREVEGRGVVAAQSACTERARLKAGGSGTRGAHRKHAPHGCDAGRVEAQRLVELTRPVHLPSRKGGMRCEARCSSGGGRAWGSGGENDVHAEGPTQGLGPGHARSARGTWRTCS